MPVIPGVPSPIPCPMTHPEFPHKEIPRALMTACHPQDHTRAVVCVCAHRPVYVCVGMCVYMKVCIHEVMTREHGKVSKPASLHICSDSCTVLWLWEGDHWAQMPPDRMGPWAPEPQAQSVPHLSCSDPLGSLCRNPGPAG